MEQIISELAIPKKYLKSTDTKDRFIALVHQTWLKSLLKNEKVIDFIVKSNFETWPETNEDINPGWMRIFIVVYEKNDSKVIPLPRVRTISNRSEPPFSFPQLLHYVSQTNHKNLWKEAYKKYTASSSEKSKNYQITLADYNNVLREIIIRTYGCSFINLCDPNLSMPLSKYYEPHSNILPAYSAIESANAIFLIHIPYIAHNIQDCIMFSPAILENMYTVPLFIVHQLLQTLRSLHDRSLTMGDVTLNDIYITDNLWIMIFPKLSSNLHVQEMLQCDIKQPNTNIPDCHKVEHVYQPHHTCQLATMSSQRCEFCGKKIYDKVQVTNQTLEQLCELWIEGQISNFTYLTALNNLAGRKYGESSCHHVFPWVTDFSSRCGKNWRDLKKSKYRLNKGDRQLDLTFDHTQTQVPHHVSDIFSPITFYVYMARRTSKTVLCKNVRTVWVSAEYPSSIQRLHDWSPDECIPEFFCDPTVFKSIHEDMDDLEVPPWSSSPEDFVEKHREALESAHVSERLHNWIDITFGYKLSGNAAVEAKNVCLPLVDKHTNLTKSGIVQLFNQPHPPKSTPSPFWNKTPPKLLLQKQRKRDRSNSSTSLEITQSEEEQSLGFEEELFAFQTQGGRSALGITRLLSRSRSSLTEEPKSSEQQTPKISKSPSGQKSTSGVNQKSSTFTSHINSKSVTQTSSNVIQLPKDYNPVSALRTLEKMHSFLSKTFHREFKPKEVSADGPSSCESDSAKDNSVGKLEFPSTSFQYDETEKTAFTNRIFAENYEAILHKEKHKRSLRKSQQSETQINCNYKQLIATRRVRELQVLGCLIVEIFLFKQLRALDSASVQKMNFKVRFQRCVTVARSCTDVLPACIRYTINLLLQLDKDSDFSNFKYPMITDLGLPPPSAHQMLQPLLNNLIPFPKQFWSLYSLLSTLQEYSNISHELNILYHFECNGKMCKEYENIERTKVILAQNVAECKVKSCARDLDNLLKETKFNNIEFVYILLPHIKELIEEPSTSVLAAWYLFDPISRAIGPIKTCETLLYPILKLYEDEPNENTIPYSNKIAKLYHHIFLLRLIVRIGLKKFLDNFITPLVEAVGGYRDYDKIDFPLHTHSEKVARKTSNLRNINESDIVDNLSPVDDDSSGGSEKNMSTPKKTPLQHQVPVQEHEPEVFEFEQETEEIIPSPMRTLIEHLEMNAANADLPFNYSAAEEALDVADIIGEDEPLNYAKDNPEICVNSTPMSPTIPIPSSSVRTEFNTIGCDVGSKKSDIEFKSDPDSDSLKQSSSRKINPADQEILNAQRSYVRNANKPRRQDSKISDMSADSLVWLSHRLGPVLTARYLSRNLLRMLTLCYVGKENLIALSANETEGNGAENAYVLSVTNGRVIGDRNASKVLDCLSSVAALYGEQLILLQYLPHMSELIALCKRKLTPNLEGGLISCLALLQHIIPYLSDSTLMDHLQDVILRNILHQTVRLLGSTRYTFPNGSLARNVLARKYLDTLYVLALRIGADMTRTHLAVPAMQRFFFIFDKVHGSATVTPPKEEHSDHAVDTSRVSSTGKESSVRSLEDTIFLELCRDGTTNEWVVQGKPCQITHVRLRDSESADSISPPVPVKSSMEELDTVISQAMDEIKQVFDSELAHTAYIPFLGLIGNSSMEASLKNQTFIQNLCYEYEQETQGNAASVTTNLTPLSRLAFTLDSQSGGGGSSYSNSFGNNVALVGNRIDVQTAAAETSDVLSLVSNRMENTSRHLRGNWLAYWEHEIGRSDKDTMFNFKQIKLQTFVGHANKIKAVHVLDNENSFMTASRDRTIKLWSLRSQGDGTALSSCQWTYAAHKKSVQAITFVESLRLALSTDNAVHIWDPFMGAVVGHLESPKFPFVNALKAVPAPSALALAATADCTVRVIDVRICSYVYELKIQLNTTGSVYCLAVSSSGNWIATGQTTGHITILDLRTGLVLDTWHAHDGGVLQIVAVGNDTVISSGMDQMITVWKVGDSKIRFNLKGVCEPVEFLATYNDTELISGTGSNRIGVHTSINPDSSFSTTKLRSDTFKGMLSSMALLPLNRLLLLGADNGSISLLC